MLDNEPIFVILVVMGKGKDKRGKLKKKGKKEKKPV